MENNDGVPEGIRPGSNQKPSSGGGAKSDPDDETLIDSAAGEPPQLAEIRFVGPYRLLRKLGEGGMGQVWLAQQSEPLQRRVALKLIRAGMYDDSLLHRFLSERQSLAIMNHPCIAKVFDAGATSEGQPYFVMEYVPGPPITNYCDEHRLSLKQRLSLFTKVCEGVQHAHQKAIIHRDLKPANILVIDVDGHPTPRIIDFGLAKSVSPHPAGETLLTQFGGLIGTRGFMSPEQADPILGDVDTRSDVYSLGVVLYVLLTGSLPFDADQWKKRPVDEVIRQLREEDPPSPSTKISSNPGTQSAIAEARSTEPRQLVSALRGDLDWITAKALDRDRARRYGTPSDLADDIERYLHSQPVLARPASRAYRFRKYVARHRVGAAVVAGLTLLMIAFVVTQAVQLRRIRRERDRADRVTDFVTGMFHVSDPSEARGNSITAREILDRASKDIDSSLVQDPELRAKMMDVMGTVYQSLGLYSQARSLVQQAVEIKRKLLGGENVETLKSQNTLVTILTREGGLTEAEALGRKTLELTERALGPKDPATVKSMNNLGVVLEEEGRYQEAEKLDRQALDAAPSVLGPEHPDTVKFMSGLANIENDLGRFPEAEGLYRAALEIQKRVVGPEHPDTLDLMNNLAVNLDNQHRPAEAETIQREVVAVQRRILGPEHPSTLRSTSNLANYVSDQERYADAEKLYRETLEIQLRILGPAHIETLLTMENLANAVSEQGRYDEAEKMEREVVERRLHLYGPHHDSIGSAAYNLACMYALQGRREEAFSVLRESLGYGLTATIARDIETDVDLKSLRGDPRFAAIVTEVRQRAASAQTQTPKPAEPPR